MKTSYSLNFQKTASFVALAIMIMSVVACQNEGKKTPIVRHTRSVGYQQPISQYNPQTGQYISSNWGAISNFNEYDLRSFMYGVNDLGQVSSRATDNTGIRFRTDRQNQSIQMLVWDSVAEQTGEAYFWSLRVVNVQSGNLTAQDDIGTVTFSGGVQNGIWSGQVTFQNNQNSGGAQGSLGRFEISAEQMFQQ